MECSGREEIKIHNDGLLLGGSSHLVSGMGHQVGTVPVVFRVYQGNLLVHSEFLDFRAATIRVHRSTIRMCIPGFFSLVEI
jgi:hypothetical protein